MAEGFSKWKQIPNQNLVEKFRKAQKFYFKLEGLQKRKLREIQSHFENNMETGGVLKKQLVIRLLDVTSSGIRRFHNRWLRITKRDRTLRQANSTMHSFDALNDGILTHFDLLFRDKRTTEIKLWALQKMLASAEHNLGKYFRMWSDHAFRVR
jgi:hypothetical protein